MASSVSEHHFNHIFQALLISLFCGCSFKEDIIAFSKCRTLCGFIAEFFGLNEEFVGLGDL